MIIESSCLGLNQMGVSQKTGSRDPKGNMGILVRLKGVLSRGSLDMWVLKNCGSKFRFVYPEAKLCGYGRVDEGTLTAASPIWGVAFFGLVLLVVGNTDPNTVAFGGPQAF